MKKKAGNKKNFTRKAVIAKEKLRKFEFSENL
jgi:hypothetical protein